MLKRFLDNMRSDFSSDKQQIKLSLNGCLGGSMPRRFRCDAKHKESQVSEAGELRGENKTKTENNAFFVFYAKQDDNKTKTENRSKKRKSNPAAILLQANVPT